ncbi:MAG: GNAT family N-acetyltransferase [Planctomycetes bacterium]|nr:GNAT family N-acetyltransferase [Planctomycetota bacterium]
MADAIIELVGPNELPLIVSIFNQIIRPPRDVDTFERRFRGRYNVLQLVARVDDRPVGFFLGFELKPTVFFAWFYGVLPDYRRQGIASQLMDAVHAWARQNEYESIRFECHNQHRPMLHLAIALGYDIVGIRWDSDRGDNLVIFEKVLT